MSVFWWWWSKRRMASSDGAFTRPASLQAIWRLGEASGTTIAESKHGYSATASGSPTLGVTSLALASSDTAIAFDGVNDKITLNTEQFDWERTQAWSVEFLVKPNVTRSGGVVDYAVFSKMLSSAPFTGFEVGLRWTGSATRINVFLINSFGGNLYLQVNETGTDLANGTTYHVVVTYSGNSLVSGVSVWINGVRGTHSSIKDTLGSNSILNNVNPTIGSRQSAQWFKGTLDEVAVYNAVLTQNDILMLHGRSKYADLAAPGPPPVPILVSTDMAADVDDCADLGVLAQFDVNSMCNIIAALTDSSNDHSAPVTRAILDHYSLTSVPVGAYQGSDAAGGSTSPYATQVKNRFRPGDTRGNYSTPTVVGRTALAAAADSSVTVLALGFATALRELLDSAADGIDARTGSALITAKVTRLVYVAGYYPSNAALSETPEFNFAQDAANASYLVANWPTEIVFVGIELGDTVKSGPPLTFDPLTNPIKYAFELSTGLVDGDGKRFAWGQLGVLYAIYGAAAGFRTVGLHGQNSVNSSTGANTWVNTSDSSDYYIDKTASDASLGSVLDALLAATE